MPTFLNRETEKTPDAPSAGSDGSNAAESDSQKLHYRLEDLMQKLHYRLEDSWLLCFSNT